MISNETPKGCISVAIIVLGAFAAGARDLSFDFYSYAVVLISNICTAVYLASIARLGTISCVHATNIYYMYCLSYFCIFNENQAPHLDLKFGSLITWTMLIPCFQEYVVYL